MLRRALIAGLPIAVLTAIGCGPKLAASVEGGPKAKKPTLQAGTWAIEDSSAAIILSLSVDGRFRAVFRGPHHRSVAKGKAGLQDKKVVLQISELDGKPPQSTSEKMPARFSFSPDWSTLTSEEGFVLKRKI